MLEDYRAATAASIRPTPATGPRPVALMFPGQGSQYIGMAAGLYREELAFTAAVDEVFEHFGPDGAAVRSDWLASGPDIDIDDVRRAQPLLFAVDYALGRMILSWGISPVAMIGHSAGEVVAATLAGVFTLPEAAGLVAGRVRTAVLIPSGGMLAVAASVAELGPYLVGDVAIAAVNATRQVMLAGSDEPLAKVEAHLLANDFTVRTVPATTPFHCSAMAPAAAEAEANFRARPRPPSVTIYSGYTGEVMTSENATSPRFWCRQLTDTVHFGPALNRLLGDRPEVLLVEAGPGQTLTALARRTPAVRSGASAVVPLLPAVPGPPELDRSSVCAAAAFLWTEGHNLAIA